MKQMAAKKSIPEWADDKKKKKWWFLIISQKLKNNQE